MVAEFQSSLCWFRPCETSASHAGWTERVYSQRKTDVFNQCTKALFLHKQNFDITPRVCLQSVMGGGAAKFNIMHNWDIDKWIIEIKNLGSITGYTREKIFSLISLVFLYIFTGEILKRNGWCNVLIKSSTKPKRSQSRNARSMMRQSNIEILCLLHWTKYAKFPEN